MLNDRYERAVHHPPDGAGWVHVGCYTDETGLRQTLDRIRRLWADRYDFCVVHAPCAAGDYRLYVKHR